MKTLKIFIILFFLSIITVNYLKAQSRVIKEEIVIEMPSQYLECTHDWVWGEILVENMYMLNNYVFVVRKANVSGYLDEAHTIPSGNVYELSQVAPGTYNWVNTGTFKLNGKVIAVFHASYHQTLNANGDVTVDKFVFWTQCK